MNIKKLYYWIVSLVSIIIITITLWILISSIFDKIYISNKEYLANNFYDINNCEYSIQNQYCKYWKDFNDCIVKIKNNKYYINSIKNCEDKKKQQLLLRRNYNFKNTIIWTWSTFIVFLILFLLHYSNFKKEDINKWK